MSLEGLLGPGRFWNRSELAEPTLDVAPALLGTYLVRDLGGELLVGRIVETEAYLAEGDPACHTYKGETPRNRPMFGPPGHAYVYKIYGIHHCFNVVTEPAGRGSAVLIRGLEPVLGQATMEALRGVKDVTNGPGKLCQALDIGVGLNDVDLTQAGPLFLWRPEEASKVAIATSPRIGITQGAEFPWRFFYSGNRWVSKGPMKKL